MVCVKTEDGEKKKRRGKKHGPGEEQVRGFKKARGDFPVTLQASHRTLVNAWETTGNKQQEQQIYVARVIRTGYPVLG